jgi:drug/metabolite transporter (DMT)-like permease
LVVAVISFAAPWEPLSAMQWLGVALGLAGVVITLADRVSRPPSAVALGWTLLGLAGLTAGTVMQSRLQHRAGPATVASVELATGFVILAVWAPLRGPVSMPLTAHALTSFAWLALVAGVGAPLLLFALIRQRGATRASSFLFVVPAVTALAAWPILGTPVHPAVVIGLAVATAGLWFASPARGRTRRTDETVHLGSASAASIRSAMSMAGSRTT